MILSVIGLPNYLNATHYMFPIGSNLTYITDIYKQMLIKCVSEALM